MDPKSMDRIIPILRRESRRWNTPVVTLLAETSRDPFKVLISTVLSARTLDGTTREAVERLFALADNPRDMAALGPERVERAIYPVGFYKTKARNIVELCNQLLERYDGRVPDRIEELVKLKGVGRKTANLVVTLGFGKPGICVDTHVHRISNRLGYVETKTPEQTERALRAKLPKRYWIEYNDLLVSLGQHVCRPLSPRCSDCPIESFCDRRGVERSR